MDYINDIEKSECYKDCILYLLPIFNQYKNKDVEIEFRFGYYDCIEKKFITGVSKELFEKIKNKLDNSSLFEKKYYEYIDYFDEKNNRKSDFGSNFEIVKKERFNTIDFRFENTPFDIRISVAKETKLKKFGNSVSSRTKKRTSFTYKHLRFDFTEIKYCENQINKIKYEIEIEIISKLNDINIKDFKNDYKICYIIHDILLKIKDFSNICEKINEEKCKFILNE